MTVSSSTNKVSYSGNGSLTTFAYSFKIFDQDDLTVILRAADGTETTQTITTHYTVSGVGEASGGNVVFGSAPASGVTVVIIREQPLTQGLDLVPNNPFPAESLEEALDKLTFMSQKHEEELGRAIKASRTNTLTGSEFTISATDRANKVFAFDGSGNLSVTQELGTFKGNWSASTAYVERDLVKDTSTNNIFIAKTAHTSSGSQPLTTNTDSAKWDLIVDVSSAAGDFQIGNDLKLASDAAVLGFGADNDVTLTHVADTGLLLNSTMQLQFNDASQFINAPSATVLDINATDEIELNATLIDVNGNLDVSGTITLGSGAVISEAELEAIDDLTAGTVAASKVVQVDANKDIASFRNLTATGAITGGSFVIGSADINENDLEAIDGVTAGTVAASKAVVVDTNKDVSSFRNLTATGAITGGSFVIGSADISETDLEAIDGITAGTVSASKALVVDADKDLTGGKNITVTHTLTGNNVTAEEPTADGNATVNVYAKNTSGNSSQPFLELTQGTNTSGGYSRLVQTFDDSSFDIYTQTLSGSGAQISTASLRLRSTATDTTIYSGGSAKAVVDGSGLTVTGNISNTSGDFTLDVAGDIILDADDGIVNFKDGGTSFGLVAKSGNNLIVKSQISDGDFVIRGNDGGSEIDAITIDMSEGGNVGIGHSSPTAPLDVRISGASGAIAEFHNTSGFGVDIGSDSDSVAYISSGYTQALAFKTNAGSGQVERLRIDSSGRLGLKTSANASFNQVAGADLFVLGSGSGDQGMTIYSGNGSTGNLMFADGTTTSQQYEGYIQYVHSDNRMLFGTNHATHLTMTSTGALQLEGGGVIGSNGTGDTLILTGSNAEHAGAGITLHGNTHASASVTLFKAGSTEVMRIGGGKVMIGTSTAGSSGEADRLTVSESGKVGLTLRSTNSDRSNIYFSDATSGSGQFAGYLIYDHGTDSLRIGTNATEQIRVDSSNNVLIGGTNTNPIGNHVSQVIMNAANGTGIHRDGGTPLKLGTDGNREILIFHINGADVGSIDVSGSSTSYNTSSDYRLKTDVQPMTGATDRLKQLNPVNFEWIADSTRSDGFLAHEVQSIVPQAITGIKDEVDDEGNAVMQGIDHSHLVPLLVKTIQELEARITALEGV